MKHMQAIEQAILLEEKLIAETRRLHADIAKLNAEAHKLRREALWYPVFVVAASLTAGAAIMGVLDISR